MEEDEYKSTYNKLTSLRCVFEKTLTNNHAKCELSRHFCLADREGYACEDAEASSACDRFLEKLREKSVFVFKLCSINGPLPHNREVRVQAGGVTGLIKLLDSALESETKTPHVENIYDVLNQVTEKFGSLDNLPYSEIIQSVEKFQGRRRRQR